MNPKAYIQALTMLKVFDFSRLSIIRRIASVTNWLTVVCKSIDIRV